MVIVVMVIVDAFIVIVIMFIVVMFIIVAIMVIVVAIIVIVIMFIVMVLIAKDLEDNTTATETMTVVPQYLDTVSRLSVCWWCVKQPLVIIALL